MPIYRNDRFKYSMEIPPWVEEYWSEEDQETTTIKSFVSIEKWQDADDALIPFFPYGVYAQEEKVRKLGFWEAAIKNPFSLIKRTLLIPAVLFLLHSIISFFIDPVPLESTESFLLITSSIVVVVFFLLGIHKIPVGNDSSVLLSYEKDVEMMREGDIGSDYPSLSNRYHRHTELTGVVFAGKVPDRILRDYNFSRDLVGNHDDNEHKVKEKYLGRVKEALNEAMDDPLTSFQTWELSSALAEYNARVPWSDNDKYLEDIIRSLFNVIDQTWTRNKEEEKKHRDLVEQQCQERERIRLEIARREAQEEVEKRLAVVKAYDDISDNN